MTMTGSDRDTGRAGELDPGPGERSTRLAALAAELHDGVSQHLFAAGLDLHELRRLPGLGPEAKLAVDRLADRIEAGARDLRVVLLAMLGPDSPVPALAPGALCDRLAEVVTEIRAANPDLVIDLNVQGNAAEPGEAAAHLLVRAVREGLLNVVKHAGAVRAQVVVGRSRRRWTVEVHDDGHDDGRGDAVTVGEGMASACSVGLASLGREAARLGGRAWIGQSPDLAGVRLKVAVPTGL